MFLYFASFAAMYVIVGTLIRLTTLKFPDNPVSTALMFAH